MRPVISCNPLHRFTMEPCYKECTLYTPGSLLHHFVTNLGSFGAGRMMEPCHKVRRNADAL